jgi:CheY-like chemotaxis protein
MSDPYRSVLVVEDDQDCRELIAEVLEADGYRVHQACNGREGLSRLSVLGDEPSLVLLDMTMPEMDGAEFLRVLGARRLTTLPVVVLSAQAQGARALGARLVISKPVDLDALLEVVRDFCGDP